MGSAGSNTVFPGWAIGLIVGGVLLLVALAIIIGRYVIEKKNKGKNENFGQIPLKPPGSDSKAIHAAGNLENQIQAQPNLTNTLAVQETSLFIRTYTPPRVQSNWAPTPVVEKTPLHDRTYIANSSPSENFKTDFLLNIVIKYNKSTIGQVCNLGDFLSIHWQSSSDIRFTSADIYVHDDNISEDIKANIANALNEFKYFIELNQNNRDMNVVKELKDCINKIDDLEPVATKST